MGIDEGNDSCFEVEYLDRTPVDVAEPMPTFEPKRHQCAMCKNEWLQKETGAPPAHGVIRICFLSRFRALPIGCL